VTARVAHCLRYGDSVVERQSISLLLEPVEGLVAELVAGATLGVLGAGLVVRVAPDDTESVSDGLRRAEQTGGLIMVIAVGEVEGEQLEGFCREWSETKRRRLR
jgi:hypothetical protein